MRDSVPKTNEEALEDWMLGDRINIKTPPPPSQKRSVIPALGLIALIAAAGAVGFVGGRMIPAQASDQLTPVVQQVQSQSDTPLAIRFNNRTIKITASELSDTLDAATYAYNASDGTPPLGLMFSYAKSYVLSSVAADEGLSASSDEVSSWLMENYSTTSPANVATLTGVSEKGVKTDAERNVLVEKLRDHVIKDASDAAAKSKAWDTYVEKVLADVVIEAQGLN